MTEEINIQTLFARLRLEHLTEYLPTKGWQGATETRGDRTRFELENGTTPFVISLPRTNTSTQSRRLLQAAVFTLCDVEDRQPNEVIRDVLAVDIPGRAVPEGTKLRLRLSNTGGSQAISVRISSRPGSATLLPGDALEILTSTPEGEICDVAIEAVSQ